MGVGFGYSVCGEVFLRGFFNFWTCVFERIGVSVSFLG